MGYMSVANFDLIRARSKGLRKIPVHLSRTFLIYFIFDYIINIDNWIEYFLL